MKFGCLVSVIIPVYNVKPYLTEALESVIHQTYENLEILIIDDGSTDGSQFICDEYKEKDERIAVVHQNNKGLSGARNVGLDLIHGEAVAFLDSDDAYHPEYVMTLIKAMVLEQSDIVVCKYTAHRTTGKMERSGQERIAPIAREGLYDRKEALIALAETRINIGVWNKIYKRELWKSIRFPEGHVYEDMDTTYRIFDACKSVYVIDQPLFLYRKRSDSITESSSWINLCDRLRSSVHFASFVVDNTPELFTDKQIKTRHLSCINVMLLLYQKYYNDGKDVGLRYKEVKEIILDSGKEMGVKNGSIQIRIIYRVLISFPYLLVSMYRFYLTSRLFVKRHHR